MDTWASLDLQVNRIYKNSHINPLEDTGSPFLHLFHHDISDAADGVFADFSAVDFFEVRCDVPVGQSFGCEGKDFLVDFSESPCSFRDDDRGESSFAVSWYLNLYRSDGVGEDGFGAVAVAGVPAIFFAC